MLHLTYIVYFVALCLQNIPEGSVILLHACAHNPTGVDPKVSCGIIMWQNQTCHLVRIQYGFCPF